MILFLIGNDFEVLLTKFLDSSHSASAKRAKFTYFAVR